MTDGCREALSAGAGEVLGCAEAAVVVGVEDDDVSVVAVGVDADGLRYVGYDVGVARFGASLPDRVAGAGGDGVEDPLFDAGHGGPPGVRVGLASPTPCATCSVFLWRESYPLGFQDDGVVAVSA